MSVVDPSSTRSVLIVDDDAIVRETTAMVLEDEGHDVATASSGREALECLERRTVDVVLLDLGLPDASGLEILGAIHTRWPRVAVIVVTGAIDVQSAVDAVKLGARDYL